MSKEINYIAVSIVVPVYNNELYLDETLRSIKEQSFPFFETIIVNDGSSDNSEKIIDKYVENDKRFIKINQENKGVSAARNAALDIAKGKYITFADGDDVLTLKSLEKMHYIAQKYSPDMIVGGSQKIDGFTRKINQRTQKLKYKKEILKDDTDLVHGLGLWNKWFLREIIEKHNLRLEPFKHLEDGVFIYNFLQYADNIKFCDAIVYNYMKRIPLLAASVTQRVEKGLLESAIGAYERIEQLTENYPESFKQELKYRINSTTFIGDYYKKIWCLDDETETLLISYIKKIWSSQTEEYKKRMIKSHPSLELEKGIRTKEDLLKDLFLTIVISPSVSENKVNIILKSIYGQAVQNIKIILDKKFMVHIDEHFHLMKNLEFVSLEKEREKWNAFNEEYNDSRFIMIVDHDVIFDYDTLAKSYDYIYDYNCDIIKIEVLGINKDLKMKENKIEFYITKCYNEKSEKKNRIKLQDEAPLIMFDSIENVELYANEKKNKSTFMKRIRRLLRNRMNRLIFKQ